MIGKISFLCAYEYIRRVTNESQNRKSGKLKMRGKSRERKSHQTKQQMNECNVENLIWMLNQHLCWNGDSQNGRDGARETIYKREEKNINTVTIIML